MASTEVEYRLCGTERATITLSIEQAGDFERVTWVMDGIEDATETLDAVLYHITHTNPARIDRYVSWRAYADLAEGAGLYE